MFTITVESLFSAVHQLRLPDGRLEPLHGHDWRVRAHFRGVDLDRTDMVIDFEAAGQKLQTVLAELNHVNLNRHAAFSDRNPTAEMVARYVFDRLQALDLPALFRVDVTEAPGCSASYQPGAPAPLQNHRRD